MPLLTAVLEFTLTKLVKLWGPGCRHPASGYVQGINDLVTPFLAVFLGEHFPREQPMSGWDLDHISQETMLEASSLRVALQLSHPL